MGEIKMVGVEQVTANGKTIIGGASARFQKFNKK